ncbi:MAG: class I SAM-dependent methyltransferase [Actinomycetia bacterium]|nr:class I SAM-dependent methyltransferase [Actinomycetes bacterium]
MPPKVSHPVFARVFARLVELDDRSGQTEHRVEMLAALQGRVIEVGAGSGANFAHYPDTVTEVVAVEPEPYLRGLAMQAAEQVDLSVTVVDGVAEDLPLVDGWADAAVASLVLCSFSDQSVALREMHRVVRPGGGLRFYEHVRAEAQRPARWQRRVDAIWPHLFGGCHTSRDTAGEIERAGWRIEALRRIHLGPPRLPNPVAPHILGTAVRGGDDGA